MNSNLHALWVGVLLAGCATGPYGSDAIVPAPAEGALAAERAGMLPGEIQRASSLHALKCARCHKFYDPATYTDSEWLKWMNRMSRKARLDAAEDDVLRRYLGAYRSSGFNSEPAASPSKSD